MSGASYDDVCPRCGGTMNCYSDWKPYDQVMGLCLDCGFRYYTVEDIANLEEVNEQRKVFEMRPLKRLRKPTKGWLDAGLEKKLTKGGD